MVSKVDEFNTVLLALDDNEVADILNALRYIGNDDLACEIEEEVFGGCDECDCGDSSVADLKISVDSTELDEAEKKLEGIKELLDALAEGYK